MIHILPHMLPFFLTKLARPLLLAWVGIVLLVVPLALARPAASLNETFEAAATEFNLPRELLVALGWVRSHLRPQISEIEEVGVMQLSPEQLSRAAALLNETEIALQNDTSANVRGAAALLREVTDQRYPGRSELAAEEWFEVVVGFSFPDNPAMGRSHARQVFGILAEGLVVEVDGESVVITPWPEAGPLATTPEVTVASDDYPAAHWVAAHEKNYTPVQRTAQEIDTIVIHTTEGSYNGVLNWFSRPEAGSSGHYVIRSRDGEVTQMVRDRDIAWHAGNWEINTRSIGIEHEAFVNDPSWYTGAMYAASAKLVRHLAQKYGIPLDRRHIIGHNEVPGCPNPGGGGASCHTDPGQYWDWDAFMVLVTAGMTDTVPPPTLTYTGTIQLQARTGYSGTMLYLLEEPCPSLQPTIAASAKPITTTTGTGQFTFTLAETEGERCLFGHQLNFLAVQRSLSTQTELGPVTLLTGDVNNDGRINIIDLSMISLKYNTVNTEVDLNGDGIVNIVDLALTAHNFGRTGPVAWPDQDPTAN